MPEREARSPVPASFFAMSALPVTDVPKVHVGALGHPGFAWSTIEQSRGVFDFRVFDDYVATAQGLQLVDAETNTVSISITLGLTPPWALSDQSSCSTPASVAQCTQPPDNIQDWKDFLTALIQHYNGVTQPHIRYYELWNEFDATNYWTGTFAQMVALAQAAYPIIHQDPCSILLTPSVAGPVGTVDTTSAVSWITPYLRAGGAQYADGGAFHGYLALNAAEASHQVVPYPMPEQDSTSGCTPFVTCFGAIVTKAIQMREVFDQNGLAGKPMFQTEGSWGEQELVGETPTQVAWIARYYLLQAGLHEMLNLQMAAWFSWGASEIWGTIETSAGQPTAAAVAYSQVFDWVVGATIAQPCSGTANGTWTCWLTRHDGYIAQAVWNTQGTIPFTPGTEYGQYHDLAGNTYPIAPGAAVNIGAQPILIERQRLRVSLGEGRSAESVH